MAPFPSLIMLKYKVHGSSVPPLVVTHVTEPRGSNCSQAHCCLHVLSMVSVTAVP